jgi:outer membrane protein assembly factor BamB
VYALNASDGTKKWSFEAHKPFRGSSPILSKDGAVLYIASTGYVYALNAVNGIKIWNTFIEGFSGSDFLFFSKVTPALSPDETTLYVGSTDNNVYALNAADGTKKWNYLTENSVGAPTVSKDGKVLYVGSYDKKMYAIHTGA